MNLKNLPKVELHLHLDCSLSFDVVKQLNPIITLEKYQDTFIAPAKCIDLADYISRASQGYLLMQTKEQLRLVTLDLFKQLKADNVIYAEIRFAPLLHTIEKLSAEEVVETVNNAVEEGKRQYKIEAGIILCTLRHYTEEQSLQTVKLVKKYFNTNVVGFDIAADEANFPIDNHIAAFQFAKESNIKYTAHAGEAKGAESVWETLEHFQTTRIGHGVRSVEDESLLASLKEKNIHLEVCPTSNIQVDVFDKIENHPIDQFYNAGLSVGINTDGRAISNVSLTDEYELLAKVFDWNINHFKNCNLAAIDHSFATADVKKRIKAQIELAYELITKR